MKTVTKVGIALATITMSLGILASPAEAKVDTSWGGCCGIVSNR